jgi:hypothetical protein
VALPRRRYINAERSQRSGRFPPPGRLINVARPVSRNGGFIWSVWARRTTVIFEPGGFGGALLQHRAPG